MANRLDRSRNVIIILYDLRTSFNRIIKILPNDWAVTTVPYVSYFRISTVVWMKPDELLYPLLYLVAGQRQSSNQLPVQRIGD